MSIALIIPALNPDDRLLNLVGELRSISRMSIVVVDDGSDVSCRPVFEKLKLRHGCMIRTHKENLGKGMALKTGIRTAMQTCPGCTGYVTADADGQHTAADIIRIGQELEQNPHSLILGTRAFDGEKVPKKSRWGNKITSKVFHMGTGVCCADTQTGLRGMPRELAVDALSVFGRRFEYEMNFLIKAARAGYAIKEVSIETVYLDQNRNSHFHPLRDSFLIYWNILKFVMSSGLSAVVDLTVFTLLLHFVFGKAVWGMLAATVAARILSGGLNFALNKQWVFGSHGRSVDKAVKYLALFLTQMFMSFLLTWLLTTVGMPASLSKIFIDGGLFVISYQIQKQIFRPDKQREGRA